MSSPEPPNLIILPGWAQSKHVYQDLCQRFVELGYRPYVHTHLLTTRDQPVEDYLAKSTQHLAQRLDELGVRSYQMIAYSFGALIAIAYSALPTLNKPSKLLLLSPAGVPQHDVHPWLNFVRVVWAWSPTLFSRAAFKTMLHAGKEFFSLLVGDPSHLWLSGHYGVTADLRPQAARLTMPVTLMASPLDTSITLESVKNLQAAIPQAKLLEVGGTHLWPFIWPEPVFQELQPA